MTAGGWSQIATRVAAQHSGCGDVNRVFEALRAGIREARGHGEIVMIPDVELLKTARMISSGVNVRFAG